MSSTAMETQFHKGFHNCSPALPGNVAAYNAN